MFLKLLASAAVLALATTSADSRVDSDDVRSWPLVSVCQVLADPQTFDGKLIRLRGVVVGTDEGGFLGAPLQCSKAYKTGDHVWPSWVALTGPGSRQRLHNPLFVYDPESEQVPFDKYRLLQKKYPDRCLLLTDAGLFETRADWSKSRAVYPNGSSKYVGFGNDGVAPAQLLLKSVVDVEVDPTCAASPK